MCEAVTLFGNDELKQAVVVPLLKGDLRGRGPHRAKGAARISSGQRPMRKRTAGTGSSTARSGSSWAPRGRTGSSSMRSPTPTHPHKRMTAFMVPRTTGVESKYIYGLMGVRGGGAGRLVLKDVRVPRALHALNGINGGFDVFVRMMIPERLGTAAMTLGSVRPAIEIATRYTSKKRKAFGFPIQMFQAVGFKVADAVMLLDAARSMVYSTCLAVDPGRAHPNQGAAPRLRVQEVRHRGGLGDREQVAYRWWAASSTPMCTPWNVSCATSDSP